LEIHSGRIVPTVLERRARALGFAATILAGFAIVLNEFGHAVYTASADLGWHYALTQYLAEQGHLPTNADAFLAAMIGYPPLAHITGALVAHAFRIPVLEAMLLTTLACIYFGYVAVVAQIAVARSSTESFLALFFFVLFMTVFQRGHLAYGNEIVGNFFYAQLVGDLGLLLAFFGIARIKGLAAFTLIGLSVVDILAWVYTLSAVKLLAGLILVRGLRAYCSGSMAEHISNPSSTVRAASREISH